MELVGLDVASSDCLIAEIKDMVLRENIPLETAVKMITSNPAGILKMNGKGRIRNDYDADLCILDEESLDIDTVIALGKIMVRNKTIVVYGTFESRGG
jgi:beta-aspartyl-dipeptidase (metallo-type)